MYGRDGRCQNPKFQKTPESNENYKFMQSQFTTIHEVKLIPMCSKKSKMSSYSYSLQYAERKSLYPQILVTKMTAKIRYD